MSDEKRDYSAKALAARLRDSADAIEITDPKFAEMAAPVNEMAVDLNMAADRIIAQEALLKMFSGASDNGGTLEDREDVAAQLIGIVHINQRGMPILPYEDRLMIARTVIHSLTIPIYREPTKRAEA